ncbi:MAG: preprotein translocase subunit SecG [Candidatus Bipolaricaulia bacterium]
MIRLILQTLFIIDALALIGLILLQMSRHSGLGGAFGAGGTHTVFGREEIRDPKRTAIAVLGVGFMLFAFLLSLV